MKKPYSKPTIAGRGTLVCVTAQQQENGSVLNTSGEILRGT